MFKWLLPGRRKSLDKRKDQSALACARFPFEKNAPRRIYIVMPLMGDNQVAVKRREKLELEFRRRWQKLGASDFNLGYTRHELLSGTQASQLYFRSSGTSNKTPYASTFFPTLGMLQNWISKVPWGRPGFGRNHKPRWVTVLLKEPLLKDSLLVKTQANTDSELWRYPALLHYFPYWSTLQQSVQLGGPFWTRPDMADLRNFALLFDWNGKRFISRQHPLPLIQVDDDERCDLMQSGTEVQLAHWMYHHQALPRFLFSHLAHDSGWIDYQLKRQSISVR